MTRWCDKWDECVATGKGSSKNQQHKITCLLLWYPMMSLCYFWQIQGPDACVCLQFWNYYSTVQFWANYHKQNMEWCNNISCFCCGFLGSWTLLKFNKTQKKTTNNDDAINRGKCLIASREKVMIWFILFVEDLLVLWLLNTSEYFWIWLN